MFNHYSVTTGWLSTIIDHQLISLSIYILTMIDFQPASLVGGYEPFQKNSEFGSHPQILLTIINILETTNGSIHVLAIMTIATITITIINHELTAKYGYG